MKNNYLSIKLLENVTEIICKLKDLQKGMKEQLWMNLKNYPIMDM